MVGDLFYGLQVGLEDRLFHVMLADIAPGVDVDGDQRFGLLNHDVSARFKPNLALQSARNVAFQIVCVKDRFGALVSFGIATLFLVQVFFNIGMVLGLLPVVGMTLPFFSYGGSSLLTCLVGVGLLLNIRFRRHMF